MILHIVPNLKPSIDGVGDYAHLLAEELHRKFEMPSSFLVANPEWRDLNREVRFEVTTLGERSVSQTFQELCRIGATHKTLFLHYVGYGYSRKGVPFWLERGLRAWKSKFPDSKLVTFFHELIGNGYPWQSGYWLRPFQRSIVRELSIISDACITNNSVSAAELLKIAPFLENRINVLPVISNIGEMPTFSKFSGKRARLVIFGSAGRRREAYKNIASQLKLISTLGITEVVDIGPYYDGQPDQIAHIKIDRRGPLPASQILDIYSDSRFGLIDYPIQVLGKSGIFGSYCSAGLVPIVVGVQNGDRGEFDGLKADVQYVLPESCDRAITVAALERLGENAFDWYRGHSIEKHGKVLHSLIRN